VHEDAAPEAFLRDVRLHQSILTEFGRELTERSMILDFGCGHGGKVAAYRLAGFQAFGADVKVERPAEWLRLIEPVNGTYRIPFEDATFDFVYSNSVLEHVEDLEGVAAEMHRVLKPDGVSLHLFPPRGAPIEPHVLVPFGGVLRGHAWLRLWAWLGVRNVFQKGLSASQVARSNYTYLHGQTFYRSKRELRRCLGRHFRRVAFADREMIMHSYGRARRLGGLVRIFPPTASLYGSLHQRCVVCVK
jgi:SAM-dependent methyltransferase